MMRCAKLVGLLPQSRRFGPKTMSLLYAGVGNISGVVLAGGRLAKPGFAQRNAGNNGAQDSGVPLRLAR